MTKEEVKKELSKLIFELGFEDNVDDKVCALNMAIRAMEKLERYEKHFCFDCKFFSENGEEYDEEHCSKCTLIGTEWEQKK